MHSEFTLTIDRESVPLFFKRNATRPLPSPEKKRTNCESISIEFVVIVKNKSECVTLVVKNCEMKEEELFLHLVLFSIQSFSNALIKY